MWRMCVVLLLAGACGGSQAPASGSSERRKLAALEDELADSKSSLEREKAGRLTAEQALVEQKAKCAAQVAAAAAVPAPAPAAAPVPAVPPAPAIPEPPPPPKPIAGRILERSAVGRDVRLILNVGRGRGVAVGWTGQVFEGKTSSKVVARFKITAVRDGESDGLIRASTIAGLGDNARVELAPPPP